MKTVNGVYASAKIFTVDSENSIDDYALAQLQMLCDHPALQDCKIRVMPDVHPGKVGTIGLTMTVGRRILPSLVGIDIGCGMLLAKIKQKKIEYQKLDAVIRENVPVGFQIRKQPHRYSEQIDLSQLYCGRSIRLGKALLSLGTLGGGNHFIEVDRDEEGNLYLLLHSGSRHLGKEVAEFYLKEGQKRLKQEGKEVPYELTYLEGQLMEAYLHDLMIVQEFAEWNRTAILDVIVRGMKWKTMDICSCIHNYVEKTSDGSILRKGAISARQGEKVIIPINMRDGVIFGTGLGNPDWNYSAPHGAGRILKREEVASRYTVSSFKAEMKGIYSSCINKDTLDEAPFAYRSLVELQGAIEETVEINQILRPVYNYKAGCR